MVLVVVRQGGWTIQVVAKDAQIKVGKRLYAAKRLMKNGLSDSNNPTKRFNLLFLRGC
jgi:hypothetical protein